MPVMYFEPWTPREPTPEELEAQAKWDALTEEEQLLFNFFLHEFFLGFAL
jgi:hypothetical protein